MTTLLLVRHGHTDAAGKRLTGWAPGVHLNESGASEAERLWSSDSTGSASTRSTPVPSSAAARPPHRSRRPAGSACTSGAGSSRPGTASGPGGRSRRCARPSSGEPWNGFPRRCASPGARACSRSRRRAVDEVNRIAQDHPKGIVVVVSHADPIRLVIAQVAGAARRPPPSSGRGHRLDHGRRARRRRAPAPQGERHGRPRRPPVGLEEGGRIGPWISNASTGSRRAPSASRASARSSCRRARATARSRSWSRRSRSSSWGRRSWRSSPPSDARPARVRRATSSAWSRRSNRSGARDACRSGTRRNAT